MNYKLEGALKKSRKSFIICAILWLVLVIVFVGPFSYSAFEAKVNGSFELVSINICKWCSWKF